MVIKEVSQKCESVKIVIPFRELFLFAFFLSSSVHY